MGIFLSGNFLADPGKAKSCSTNRVVIHWFIILVNDPLPPLSWQRRKAQTAKHGASSHKIYYVAQAKGILNLQEY